MIHKIMLSLVCVLCVLESVAAQGDERQAKDLAAKASELAGRKEFEQAAALMKKAVLLAPANDKYLGDLSELEFKTGKFADGLEHARAAIKLNDKVATYYLLGAMHALKEQERELAREFCETVVKRDLGSAAVQNAQQFLKNYLDKRTFTLHWKLDPQRGRIVNGAIAIAVPRTGLPYQSVSYEVSGVKSHKLVRGEVNDVVMIVPQGKEPFPLTFKIVTQPYSYKKLLAKASPSAPLPADAKASLGPIATIDPKSPTLKKLSASLKGDNAIARVGNIQAWLKKNIEYKLQKKTIGELDFKSVDDIVKRGHAECRGCAMLFTGLCRAAGIPARPIWGMYKVPPGDSLEFGNLISHNWAEVYIAGAGWVPVDPQWPESLGFIPNNYMHGFMDAQKLNSADTLPLFNLLVMQGKNDVRLEEGR